MFKNILVIFSLAVFLSGCGETDKKKAIDKIIKEKQADTVIQKKIKVNMEIEHKVSNDGFLKILINSNLPEDSKLLVTLSNKSSGYRAQSKTTIKNGYAETELFSNKNKRLDSGSYLIKVILPNAALQPKRVSSIIGKRGENLIGELVTEGIGGFNVEKEKVVEVILNNK